MTDEERAREWFRVCDNGNGVVVPLPMNIKALAAQFAKVREEAMKEVQEQVDEASYNAMVESTWARDP